MTSNDSAAKSKRVIVVGAGWAGLAAAKTYLQVDPSIDLTIIDAESTLGGVWAKRRLHPGLISDSSCGYFEFSDMPMSPVVGLNNADLVPGEKVYEYLSAWADKHYLKERMRLKTRVTRLIRNSSEQAWDVTVEFGGGEEILTCDKLILATGLASQPDLPDVRRDSYAGALSPSIFPKNRFGYNFLDRRSNSVGSWINNKIWEIITTSPFTTNSKSENTEELPTFQQTSITPLSSSAAILTTSDGITTTNPSDVNVFPRDWSDYAPFISHNPSLAFEIGFPTPLSSLSPSDKDYLTFLDSAADSAICTTFPELSDPPDVYMHPATQNNTPFRLYRNILAPALAAKNDRSLIHLGPVATGQYSIYSEVSALWGIAWMEGLFTPSCDPANRSKIEMDEEVAKVNAWHARRQIGRRVGKQFAAGEIGEVVNVLMADLGLSPYRKGWFGIKDIFVPYRSQDYEGIVEEVLTKDSMSGQNT